MMVTGGGGGARSASIHDANGRGPRVLSHASLRMHALTVHPSARRSTRSVCTHSSPMHASPSMRDANGRGSYLLALLVLLCMRVHSCARLPIRPMCSHGLPMHAIGSITASGLTSCECSPTQAAGSGISRSHYGCSSLHPLVSVGRSGAFAFMQR